ncbi:amidohydrolase family protein [Gordonia sp. OPL2]|uniref:amidohydrolase family protein n=1 Tax=Gordonia sp. OPL2 TaxID=2486274 RepID=UPI001655D58E|nr:amidohydrolase family protein [Gordonia sp. OPL2]ROZ84378.1 amidohydrolase family protein [Gordonia sp. OPL2]
MTSNDFVIRGARVFDGEHVHDNLHVRVIGTTIADVGPSIEVPDDVEIIDASGKTLMPGIIDSHAHAKPPAIEAAIVFGVTTEMDMGSVPSWMHEVREQARTRNDVADVRSSSFGATVLGGHPSMLIGSYFEEQFPVVSGIDDVESFVEDRISEGADYIKILIDNGTAMGHPSPTLTPDVVKALVDQAHRHQKMAVAHVTAVEGAHQAIDAGVDGLVHLFMDQPPTPEIVRAIKDSGVFVVPTLVTLGSLAGEHTGETLAADPRAEGLLPAEWRENLQACWHLGGPSRLDYSIEAARQLHAAGVPLLMGTDAASIGVVGTAHGISVHAEMKLLVRAGLTPVEALHSATALPARIYGLTDRGRIGPALQADLLLIDGDPTVDIDDTLSIDSVWRRGEKLNRDRYRTTISA